MIKKLAWLIVRLVLVSFEKFTDNLTWILLIFLSTFLLGLVVCATYDIEFTLKIPVLSVILYYLCDAVASWLYWRC